MGIKGFMNMTGYEWVGVVALLIAFVTFVGVVVWALTRSKRVIDHTARLPLEDHDAPPPDNGRTNGGHA